MSVTPLSTTQLHLLLALLAAVAGAVSSTGAGLVAGAAAALAATSVMALRAWVLHVGAGVLADPQRGEPLDPAGDAGQRLAHAA